MKKVYELVFWLENGESRNLLYSSYKRALFDSKHDYSEGSSHPDGIISHSCVIPRILF